MNEVDPPASGDPPATGAPLGAAGASVVADPDAARARALASWEAPFVAELGPRCPRCGERLGKLASGPDPAAAEPAPAPCPRCGVDPCSAQAGARLVPRGSLLRELARGAAYLPRGAFEILVRPRLWKWAAVPTLLNVLTILGALYLAGLADAWLEAQTSAEALADWTGWWWGSLSWVVRGLGALGGLLSWLLIPLLATWLIVAPPLSILYKILFMPVMELLAEGTDQLNVGLVDVPFDLGRFLGNVAVAVVDAVLLTLLQGLCFLVLLPLMVIPGLWFLPPALFAGMDYSDLNLVRRAYTTREKARLWQHHPWRFLGYGVSFCFLITLPLVNMVVIPAAAAGGALLYLELERK